MPELPEVETLASQLRPKISGRQISRIRILGKEILKTPPAVLEEKIPGRPVRQVVRRGKFLGFELEGENTLWFHLGMTGQLRWQADLLADKHTHLILQFEGADQNLAFRDIRKFGEVFLTNGNPDRHPEGLRKLGPEPSKLTENGFIEIFKGRTGRIKSLLLNQRLIAGLGNIYADESLHRAGIHPRLRANRLNRERLAKLRRAICETLEEAIRCGGSSIDDYIHINGESGKFQNRHRVYGRAGKECFNCKTVIRKIVLAGRSSAFCPQCQK